METTTRGWRKVADSENDKAQAVNDALEDADADVSALDDQLAAVAARFSTSYSGTFTIGSVTLTFVAGLLTDVAGA